MKAAKVEKIKEPSTALVVPQAASPMQMLQSAIDQKMDPAIIEKMLDLRDRWEASEAKKAYMEAVASFKANPPKVYKDRLNKQYGSKYTSLANLVNTVNASLSQFGLNARWDCKQADNITVTCILSHVQGHSESVSLSGPPDVSGAKNTLQQIKSTITYLKIATFELVTGIASEEGNQDDDGNASGTGLARITAEQASNLQALIDEIGKDAGERATIKAQFLKYRQVDSLEDIASQAYQDCVRGLEARRKSGGK